MVEGGCGETAMGADISTKFSIKFSTKFQKPEVGEYSRLSGLRSLGFLLFEK